MKTQFDVRSEACAVFDKEIEALQKTRDALGADFEALVELVLNCFRFVRDFRGEVPGASAKDCGNYLDMNLPMANYWGAKYAALLENIDETRLVYPE